jgi:hypothetical protein
MSEGSPEAADRCPYPRPFSWYFNACPAFLPRLHLPTDIRGNPLHAHWTCAHLVSRRQPDGGFYPSCTIGAAEERASWAAQMEAERLTAIRLARVELSQAIRPQLEHLRRAVVTPYGALEGGRRAEARAAWSALSASFDGFVGAHPELFEAAGINTEALRSCFREATAEFSTRPPGGRWEMSEEILRRYPRPIQVFFRPELVGDRAAGGPAPPG